MKITGMAMVVAVLGTNGWAKAIASPKPALTVCIGGTKDIEVAGRAEAVASSVFSKIGVRLQWRTLDNCPRHAIQVSLQTNTPAGQHPGALAYSLPYEGTHIIVFLDRVANLVDPPVVPYLLGHVVAHEVTHILQGEIRHSPSGVMKDRWDREDYRRMAWQPFSFTPEDVRLIQRGLEVRAEVNPWSETRS